jgi:hypothetical protein
MPARLMISALRPTAAAGGNDCSKFFARAMSLPTNELEGRL